MSILAIDIGGMSLKYRIYPKFIDTKTISTRDSNREEVLKIIIKLCESIKGLTGLALSAPGSIMKNGYINGNTGIKNWNHFNVIDELRNRGIKVPITVINDGNAAAYAEKMAWKKDNLALFTIGTGIGGGIVLNGNIVYGHKGFGGELGYLTTFTKENKRPISGSEQSGFYRLEERYFHLTGKKLTGKQIFNLYDKGEKVAKKEIKDFLLGIGILIWNIVFSINPEIIVIGGGLVKRSGVLKEIQEAFSEISKRMFFYEKDIVKIVLAKNGSEAGIIGAYNYFKNKMEKNNE